MHGHRLMEAAAVDGHAPVEAGVRRLARRQRVGRGPVGPDGPARECRGDPAAGRPEQQQGRRPAGVGGGDDRADRRRLAGDGLPRADQVLRTDAERSVAVDPRHQVALVQQQLDVGPAEVADVERRGGVGVLIGLLQRGPRRDVGTAPEPGVRDRQRGRRRRGIGGHGDALAREDARPVARRRADDEGDSVRAGGRDEGRAVGGGVVRGLHAEAVLLVDAQHGGSRRAEEQQLRRGRVAESRQLGREDLRVRPERLPRDLDAPAADDVGRHDVATLQDDSDVPAAHGPRVERRDVEGSLRVLHRAERRGVVPAGRPGRVARQRRPGCRSGGERRVDGARRRRGS